MELQMNSWRADFGPILARKNPKNKKGWEKMVEKVITGGQTGVDHLDHHVGLGHVLGGLLARRGHVTGEPLDAHPSCLSAKSAIVRQA